MGSSQFGGTYGVLNLAGRVVELAMASAGGYVARSEKGDYGTGNKRSSHHTTIGAMAALAPIATANQRLILN
ncbi:hypothetical protein ABIE24_002809 [Mycetocola sp. 2940]